ncbi:MAG: class I SAM-dependent methyltransferase [Pseudomonadota bacterium]
MARRKFPKMNAVLDELDVALVDKHEVRAERARLEAFEAKGGLDRPAYALSPGLDTFDLAPLLADYTAHYGDLERLRTGAASGYRPGNGYFDTPDAEALYLMIRRANPRHVIEIGCGHSTRVTRQALDDAGAGGTITAVDPWPRADIADVVDRFEQTHVEQLDGAVFDALGPGDVLFIDTSHQVRMSNDVAHLFCRIIPALPSGVVIHVHDVFLPYEYPKRFFYDCPGWGEQYMLHALLQGGGYEILWPGYYLQQACPDARAALPFLSGGRAQSFWIVKK